jgi:hypothetical protein
MVPLLKILTFKYGSPSSTVISISCSFSFVSRFANHDIKFYVSEVCSLCTCRKICGWVQGSNGIQDQFPSFQITVTGHLLVQHFMFYVSFAYNVIGMNSIVQGLLNSFVG